jgi:hypothetical protein
VNARVLIADDDTVVRDVVGRYSSATVWTSQLPTTGRRRCGCSAPNASTSRCST